MAWTAPKTWVVGEPMTAADINVHLRDNLLALKAPPTTFVRLDEANDYSTTSTAFVAIDNTKLNLSITTTGGDVLIVFMANITNTTYHTYFDVEFDGVVMGGDNGLMRGSPTFSNITLVCLKQGVSAGAHTVRLLWKSSSAAAASSLYAGPSLDLHPTFWVREV